MRAAPFHVSSDNFMRALKAYAKECNMDMADAMNKTAKDIAFKSVGKTIKMAEVWPVRVQDSPRLMSNYKKKGTGKGKLFIKKEIGPWQMRQGNRFRNMKTGKMVNTDAIYFAEASKLGFRKGGGTLTKEAQRLYTRRRTAKGYTSWGWAAAIIGMGGTITNKNGKKFDGHGQAKWGKAFKANPHKHKAVISNTAAGVSSDTKAKAFEAMQAAGRQVYNDRVSEIRKRLRKRATERSGRKNAVSSIALATMKGSR
jgi:hypothetical protein